MGDNLLQFPKARIVRDVSELNNQKLLEAQAKGTVNFADSIATEYVEDFAVSLQSIGVDTNKEVFAKDLNFLHGVVSGIVYRALDIAHPMQDFIDDHVVVIDVSDGEKAPEPELT